MLLLVHSLTLSGKKGHHPTLPVMDFLHTGTKTEDYERAARYLYHRMQDDVYSVQSLEGSSVLITDQEKAIQKAFKWAFQSQEEGPPVYLLCSVHMQQNLYDTLLRTNSKETTSQISQAVFGEKGLVQSKSEGEYFQKFLEISAKYQDCFTAKHLETLYDKVWSGIVEPKIIYPEITTTTNRYC